MRRLAGRAAYLFPSIPFINPVPSVIAQSGIDRVCETTDQMKRLLHDLGPHERKALFHTSVNPTPPDR